MIPESHPLQQLFIELVGRHYAEEIGLRDPQIVNYVAHLMAEFCDARTAIQDPQCRRPAFDRCRRNAGGIESRIRSGAFVSTANARCVNTSAITHFSSPECFRKASITSACAVSGMENFVDWIKAGKESYYVVSKFEHFEYAKVAPLFASLSQNFEQCVYGLNLVKNDLQEMQHPLAQRANELLM